MEERGVRTRVNNSQVYVWEDAVQYAVFPLSTLYTDAQVGDFVNFTNGQLVRSPSATTVGNLRGVVVGIAPDSGEYPAFGAPFNNPLVAILSPNKTELLMRQIDDNGNYVAEPSLRQNDPVKIVYNANTRRWGVQLRGSNENQAGRVIQVLNDGRLLILFGG